LLPDDELAVPQQLLLGLPHKLKLPEIIQSHVLLVLQLLVARVATKHVVHLVDRIINELVRIARDWKPGLGTLPHTIHTLQDAGPFVCVHVIEPKRVGDVSPVPIVAVTIFKLAQASEQVQLIATGINGGPHGEAGGRDCQRWREM